MTSGKQSIIKNVVFVSMAMFFLLNISGLAFGDTISITKDDMRDTEQGKTLHRLNKEIKDLKEDWKNPKNSAIAKKAISNMAKSIKYGKEYQDAVNDLKPLMGKMVTCYGSMCNSSRWKKDAVESLLRNPSHTNCFWDLDGAARCQSSPPEPDQLYGATPAVVADEPDPSEGNPEGDCPYEFPSMDVPADTRTPYWGCVVGLSFGCGTVQCITCPLGGSHDDYSSVSTNLCPGDNPLTSKL